MKLLVIAPLLICISCAYSIGNRNRSLPGGNKTVHIKMFTNQTQAVGAEVLFTNAISKEMQRSGFAAVADKDSAELVLEGRILSITYGGITPQTAFTDANGVAINAALFTRYRLDAIAKVEVRSSVDDSILWRGTIRGSKNFLSPRITAPGARTSNPLYNQSIKDENIQLVANEMMNEAFDQLTENF